MKYTSHPELHQFLTCLLMNDTDILYRNGSDHDIELDEYADAYDDELDWDETTLIHMINNGMLPRYILWRY